MKILEPVKFKNLELKNRIVWLPAVSWLADEEGFVTDELIERHVERAKGGIGMTVIEATGVLARKSPKLLRINDDKFIPGLTKLVDGVHEAGSKISVQLIHYVKQSSSGWKQDVKDLTNEEIELCIQDHVDAIVRAKKCGFDAIELHDAHGYTLSSFTSLLNKRTDEFGRGTEGKCKIVTDILKRAREAVGPDYCLGIRISGEEFVLGGNTLKQTKEMAKIYGKAGIDYMSVSAGGKTEDGAWYKGYSGNRCMPTANYPDGLHRYLADGIREVLEPMGIPVIVSGKITSLEMGEDVLNKGEADLIGVCRPLLADPEWITKQDEGRQKEIVKCIYCNECLERDQRWEVVNCAVRDKVLAKQGK